LKRYEVNFLAEAIDDLDSLFCYIAEKTSIEVAGPYLARIEKLCLSLEFFPQRGTSVTGDVEGLRTMGFERRATILFRVRQERIDILRILYGGQNLEPVIEKL
jgi:toxin ParE1/3/4